MIHCNEKINDASTKIIFSRDVTSDVARPLSYKTKTTYFFKTKTGQVKTKTTSSRPRPLF